MALTTLDISALSIGGSSFLTDLPNATATIEGDVVRNDSITDTEESEQLQKLSCRLSLPLMSTTSNPDRVSDLNVTVATLGGENLLTYGLQELTLDVSYARQEKPNAGSWFKYPQNVKRRITGSVLFSVPDAGTATMLSKLASTTHSDKVMTIACTVNSVAISMPVLLQSVEWQGERDGLQMLRCSLGARKGTANPTGTTSLLEKALNAYRTALAIVLTTKASGGQTISGDFIFDSLSFQVRDGELVMAEYAFLSQGAFTSVVSS